MISSHTASPIPLLQAEFEDTIYTYMELFKQDNIELHYEGSDELFPPIPSDPERLKHLGAVAASGNALGGLRYLRHRLHHIVDEDHVGHVHHAHATTAPSSSGGA